MAVIDSKMISRDLLGLPDLPRSQTLVIHKLAMIIIIGKYKNFKFTTFYVVTPSIKGFNYGQQFLIVGFIPSCCQNHFPQVKGYGVPLA